MSQPSPWKALRTPSAVVVAGLLVVGGTGTIDDFEQSRHAVTVVNATTVGGVVAAIVLSLLVWRSARVAASSGAALTLVACVEAVLARGVSNVRGSSAVLGDLAVLSALAGGVLLGHAVVCTILEQGKRDDWPGGPPPFALENPFRPGRMFPGLSAGLVVGGVFAQTLSTVGTDGTGRGDVFLLLSVGAALSLTAILCPLGPIMSTVAVVTMMRLDPHSTPLNAAYRQVLNSTAWQTLTLAVCLALILAPSSARHRTPA